MDNIEMIEKLMEKADVTYEEGRGVLESVNWNLLDALVALEKEGKLKEKEPASYSTRQDISAELENIKSTEEPEGFRKTMRKCFAWIREKASRGMDNRFRINRRDGSEIIGLPVTVLVILLIAAFCTGALFFVCIAFVICFFCGCTFSFEGDDLGTEEINAKMAKIKFTGGKNTESGVDINDKK